MEKAIIRITTASVLGFISAAVQLFFAFISMTDIMMFDRTVLNIMSMNTYTIVDVLITLLLSVLIAVKKSRVSAIILFSFYVRNIVNVFSEGLIAKIIVIYISIVLLEGIVGTITYQNIKKQEQIPITLNENETEKNA